MTARPSPLPLGRHVMLDLVGWTPPVEAEGEWMLARMRQAVDAAGARQVHHHVETFDGSISPPGFAAVVLLDESHLSAHCYSDSGLLAIDAFTCGGSDCNVLVDHLIAELNRSIPGLKVVGKNEQDRFITEVGDDRGRVGPNSDDVGAGSGIRGFLERHYRHFNAAALADATTSLRTFLADGGQLMVSLAGAMSSAEIGRSLAPLIRAGKIAAISTTGANLEEDLFNLVAHSHYHRIPDWRSLSAEDEADLAARGLNRVTDTCIPEQEAIRRIESHILDLWQQADASDNSRFPHEYLCELLLSGALDESYEADPADSWLLAAATAGIPIFTPGWEDSTLGNILAARCLDGTISGPQIVKGGLEAMLSLADWYRGLASPAGLLQVGGGIAGDFPICVVPMLRQDLSEDVPHWAWFCQVSEATSSYGGYSGAPPGEKISWDKLGVDTPSFIIESDATIVLPLLFTALL